MTFIAISHDLHALLNGRSSYLHAIKKASFSKIEPHPTVAKPFLTLKPATTVRM